MMNIHARRGDKVRFLGCDKYQVRWGGNDDPTGILTVGKIYTVDHTEIHTQHTKVHLQGISGRYNSVCFEDVRK
jgi:hypothetical protein